MHKASDVLDFLIFDGSFLASAQSAISHLCVGVFTHEDMHTPSSDSMLDNGGMCYRNANND